MQLQLKTGNYFTLNNPSLIKAKDKAIDLNKRLNAKGKLATFAAGAIGGGLSDAVFVGDVEEMGTFGDLLEVQQNLIEVKKETIMIQ